MFQRLQPQDLALASFITPVGKQRLLISYLVCIIESVIRKLTSMTYELSTGNEPDFKLIALCTDEIP